MDLEIIITKFTSEDADKIINITENSFKDISKRERPKKLHIARVINTFSNLNPAGSSIIAYAVVGNKRVGCCAAIPFRLYENGVEVIGYQIGSFFVASNYHGMGIGTNLIRNLTLFFDENIFVFSYPNKRSISIFLKNGYKSTEIIPTYIYFSGITKIMSIFKCKDYQVNKIKFEEAINVFNWKNNDLGLIKDKRDFIWKYSYEKDTYQIYQLNFNFNKILIITTEHVYMGIRFKIICDIYGSKDVDFGLIIEKFTLIMPFYSIIYINISNLKMIKFPFLRIPKIINPRQIILVKRIKNFKTYNFETITSDWMGF